MLLNAALIAMPQVRIAALALSAALLIAGGWFIGSKIGDANTQRCIASKATLIAELAESAVEQSKAAQAKIAAQQKITAELELKHAKQRADLDERIANFRLRYAATTRNHTNKCVPSIATAPGEFAIAAPWIVLADGIGDTGAPEDSLSDRMPSPAEIAELAARGAQQAAQIQDWACAQGMCEGGLIDE